MEFIELAKRLDKHDVQRVLVFDPGHTTGWAYFTLGELDECGEIDTSTMESAVKKVGECVGAYAPDVVVMEDYRVYKWRAKHHIGSELLTVQVIGCIQTIAIQEGIHEIIKQPAHIAKGFCNDAKLKEWGYYQGYGDKHANDAIRHGCYYLLFGPIQKKDKIGSTVG